jgi:hypothetical protein
VQLIFANEVELGWDDSLIRIEPCTYKIRVGDEWYKTKKVLSNRAAKDLTGHACRVWLATIGESATEVVIKDSWQGDGSEPEHDIQRPLFSKADELDLSEVKKYFFTFRSYERVKIDGIEDTTSETILCGLNTNNLGSLKLQSPKDSDGAQVELSVPSHRPHLHEVGHRYHYRIAMEEVGKPVWQIDDFEHALIAYTDAIIGE